MKVLQRSRKMKNSLRIHKWTHNEFNIFILGVLTHPPPFFRELRVDKERSKETPIKNTLLL